MFSKVDAQTFALKFLRFSLYIFNKDANLR
jgi:hypothetical protein